MAKNEQPGPIPLNDDAADQFASRADSGAVIPNAQSNLGKGGFTKTAAPLNDMFAPALKKRH
jgi:hypothetical protein